MKGHSERVPGKNMRACAGKPLCSYVLSTLAGIPEISEILVNTDSDEIAEYCESLEKVVVIRRPESLAGDFVSMNKIIEHDLAHAKNNYVLQTHSTNPLLKSETVVKGISIMEEENKYDSVFSVTRHQSRFFTADMNPINHDPNKLERTQDLPPVYEENSNIYLFSKTSFKASGGKRIGNSPGILEMDKLESLDIDEEEDFLMAEVLIGKR